jgi:hypothetical protein
LGWTINPLDMLLEKIKRKHVLTSLQHDFKKKQRHMVQLVRSAAGMSDVFGFILEATNELVLIHYFDSEAFCLNGYDILRQQDIRSYCFFDDPRYWRFRAIRRMKIRPIAPVGISLSTIPNLLESVSSRYPILSVHHERPNRVTTYVGRIVNMGKRRFAIADTNFFGQWTRPHQMRYEDVTRVCFDGGYLRASAMTTPKSLQGNLRGRGRVKRTSPPSA